MQFMNLIELLIFSLKRDSRVSRHPPYARPEVVVHGNLHVNKYRHVTSKYPLLLQCLDCKL